MPLSNIRYKVMSSSTLYEFMQFQRLTEARVARCFDHEDTVLALVVVNALNIGSVAEDDTYFAEIDDWVIQSINDIVPDICFIVDMEESCQMENDNEG